MDKKDKIDIDEIFKHFKIIIKYIKYDGFTSIK
jgi:hypothetical protein